MAGKSVDNRFRNWSFIVYPESAPNDWIMQLDDLHVETYISPLHDKDVNPTGELKKPHFHVIICFEGKKSFEQVKTITDSLNAPHPQYINSIRGMARYLCHLDNPEKVQYSPSNVFCLGGADYFDVIHLKSDDRRIRAEILKFLKDADIRYYSDLVNVCISEYPDWLDLVTTNTILFKSYISERRYKIKDLGSF